MGMLADKKILITGLLSNRSIAYGIAPASAREPRSHSTTSTRISRIVSSSSPPTSAARGALPCDVTSDEQIAALFGALGREWGGLDGLLHSIAFAPREALAGDFLNALTRDAFRVAHDVSSYSFAALAKGARPLLQGRRSALLTLTYLGAARAIQNYNVMGLAKASLEANVRYLAQTLGPEGIRVNAISAGPIKTLAAAGIGGFSKILNFVETASLRRITIDKVGNVAASGLRPGVSAVTGEITYVDVGFPRRRGHAVTERSRAGVRACRREQAGHVASRVQPRCRHRRGGHNGLVCACASRAAGFGRGVRTP
jgi:enoyl-[acyl-carrier protein] reductase I